MFQKIIDQLAWPKLKKDILNYNFNSFKADFLAGILVAAVGFPSLMAFALLAGLSPFYGLYSFIIAAIVGTFVGVSKNIIWGPTSVIALMIASALGSFAVTGSAKIEIVILLTFMVGAIQLLLSFLDFGGLSNFISRSVIAGLMAGIGVVVAVGQLVRVLGLEMTKNGNVFSVLYHIIANLENINLYTSLVALSTLIIILVVDKLPFKNPSYLVGVIFSAAAVYFFGLESEITMLKSLQSSISGIIFPNFDIEIIIKLFSYAFTIAILGFLDVVILSEFNRKGAIQEEEVNKELFGLGIINVACALFNGFAGGGSFSRSFANYKAGARTRFSQLIAGILVLLFLVFFSGVVSFIPIASLGVILIIIAFQMVNIKEIKTIFITKEFDALIFIATFLATILIPRLDYAVYLAILFSLLLVAKSASGLNYSYLKIEGDEIKQKAPEEIEAEDEIVINISGTLHFSTVDKLEKQLEKSLELGRSFIIRMRNVEEIDLTTLSELDDFVDDVKEKGGEVYFTGLSEVIKEDLKEYGLKEKIGEDKIFLKEEEVFKSTRKALRKARKNNN